MSKYSNEEEQLIEWFQKNYKNILVGLFLGLSIGFGFNYFQDMKSNTQHELSLKSAEELKLQAFESIHPPVPTVTEPTIPFAA